MTRPGQRPRGAAFGRGHLLRYLNGPFSIQLSTPLADVARLVTWSYGAAMDDSSTDDSPAHFNVTLRHRSLPRRLLAPQVMFQAEDSRPLAPFPRDHAFALLEWGVNWCIATRAHQYLMLHAGAVERDGRALILPAMPGSGKSTLTAALIARGWRLLSDEFGLLDHQSGRLHPLPRAIPLKNRSIDVIRRFWPDADIGPVFTRTRKGDVAHLRPPAASLIRQAEPADPAWILFPQYVSGSPVQIGRQPQSQVFTRLSQNAFNYNLLGAVGFRSLSALVRDCPCWSIRYGDLDAVIAAIGRLTGTDGS